MPALSKVNYGSIKGEARKSIRIVDNEENTNLISDSDVKKKSVESSPFARSSKRRKGNEKSLTSAVEESLFYNANDDEAEVDSDAIEDLKRSRSLLMKNVKDPLADCVAEAQSARVLRDDDSDELTDMPKSTEKKIKTPRFRKEKKSTHTLKFNSSESEDDSDEEGVKLSEVPERYTSKRKPQEIQIGELSMKKTRTRFTEAEDEAIRDGVDRFGSGKWVDIKSHYSMVLKNRDTVQIKDRWRTLNK
jgi:hypothetical protein